MSDLKPYSYAFRPGHGSAEMLIEFNRGSGTNEFMKDLFSELSAMNAALISETNVFMSDETWFNFTSSAGDFYVTWDIWGFVFLMSKSNQEAVYAVHEHLQNSAKFESERVDYSAYRTKKTEGGKPVKDEPPPEH